MGKLHFKSLSERWCEQNLTGEQPGLWLPRLLVKLSVEVVPRLPLLGPSLGRPEADPRQVRLVEETPTIRSQHQTGKNLSRNSSRRNLQRIVKKMRLRVKGKGKEKANQIN